MTFKTKLLPIASLFVLLCLTIFQPATAQNHGPSADFTEDAAVKELEAPLSVFQYMQHEEIKKIEISTDLTWLMENKKTDKYQKASITFKGEHSQTFSRDIKIRTRGKSRRRICDFPPLKLKFKKEDLDGTGLDSSFNTLKLVTHCLDPEEGDSYLLKEFLAYKLHNELTENSFKVQLVKITYVDQSEKVAPMDRYGFLIENNDEMAKRLSGKNFKGYGVTREQIAKDNYMESLLFQYMIGNTDWVIEQLRNVKLVKVDNKDEIITVPYDFDFSGFVNTHYARTNPDLKVLDKNVRVRHFMGSCVSLDELQPTIQHFQQKKEQLLSVIKEFDELPKRYRRDLVKFIKSFYEVLDDPEILEQELSKICVK